MVASVEGGIVATTDGATSTTNPAEETTDSDAVEDPVEHVPQQGKSADAPMEIDSNRSADSYLPDFYFSRKFMTDYARAF